MKNFNTIEGYVESEYFQMFCGKQTVSFHRSLEVIMCGMSSLTSDNVLVWKTFFMLNSTEHEFFSCS